MSGSEDDRHGRANVDLPEEIDTDITDIIELDQDELQVGDEGNGQFDVEGSPSKSQEDGRDREQMDRKDDDKNDRSREKAKDQNRNRDRNRDRDHRDRRDTNRRDSGGRRDQRGGRFHPYGGRDREGGRDRTMGRAVFVSNIPFEMKWQELKDIMRKEVGEVTYTELFMDGEGKSKGVGVVEFASRESVNRCIDKMSKFQIRGRGLVVKADTDKRYSDKHRRVASKEQKARALLTPQVLAQLNLDPNTIGDTIRVSNVPWDVDWKELKDVFSIAGVVLHADVLMDSRGKSKGVATLRFESIFEAVNAISMFDNQTLYNRKLVVRMEQGRRERDSRPAKPPLPSGLARLGPSLESLTSGIGGGLGGGSRGGLGGGMGGGLGGGIGGGGGNMGNMGMGNMGNMGNMGGMDSGLGNLGNFSSGLGGGGFDSNRMSNIGGSSGLGGSFGSNLGSGLSGNLGSGLSGGLGGSLGGMGGFGGGDLSQSSLGMSSLSSLGGMGSDLSLMGNMGGNGGGSGGFGLLGSGMGIGKDNFGDGMRDDRDRDRGRDRGDRDRRGGGRERERDRDNFRGRGGEFGSQVFVRNLPFKYTWQDLKDRFKSIGPVQFAEIKINPETRRSKGYGTVRFQNPESASRAVREMNGLRLDGREIEVTVDYA